MIKRKLERVRVSPYLFEVVPVGSGRIVTSLQLCRRLDLNVVDNRDDVLTWVAVWSTCDCHEPRLDAVDATLFLQLSQNRTLGILTVIYETTWECKMALKGITTSCDE